MSFRALSSEFIVHIQFVELRPVVGQTVIVLDVVVQVVAQKLENKNKPDVLGGD